MEHVILVDKNDRTIGTMEKMEAHRKGVLHRAFSVVLFNDAGQMLLQKRSSNKYHSSGLWTNTCCSHPLPGENVSDAAHRRLREEMGIDLEPTFSHKFMYEAKLDNGLTENELDHVFVGTWNGTPAINRTEVEEWKYADLSWLKEDVIKNPLAYTAWFRILLSQPEINSIPA